MPKHHQNVFCLRFNPNHALPNDRISAFIGAISALMNNLGSICKDKILISTSQSLLCEKSKNHKRKRKIQKTIAQLHCAHLQQDIDQFILSTSEDMVDKKATLQEMVDKFKNPQTPFSPIKALTNPKLFIYFGIIILNYRNILGLHPSGVTIAPIRSLEITKI